MKKIKSILTIITFVTVLTGCGSIESESKPDSTAETTTNSVETATASESLEDATDESIDDSKTPNEYGFYSLENPAPSGVSIADLAGEWYLADDIVVNILTINFQDMIYEGTWEYRYKISGARTGYVRLEYSVENDIKSYWINLYENDGELWESFGVTGEIPLEELFGNQPGEAHFVRDIVAYNNPDGV